MVDGMSRVARTKQEEMYEQWAKEHGKPRVFKDSVDKGSDEEYWKQWCLGYRHRLRLIWLYSTVSASACPAPHPRQRILCNILLTLV